jgi:hypothetical protein
MLRGTLWFAVLMVGPPCSGQICNDLPTEFYAQWGGVNVTGFQDEVCTVTFSRGQATASYAVPLANGPQSDAALPSPSSRMVPEAGVYNQACSDLNNTVVSCTSGAGSPLASCERSMTCLNVWVSGPQGDRLAADLGGTDYHVTVSCGGVVLYQADDNAHRRACGG